MDSFQDFSIPADFFQGVIPLDCCFWCSAHVRRSSEFCVAKSFFRNTSFKRQIKRSVWDFLISQREQIVPYFNFLMLWRHQWTLAGNVFWHHVIAGDVPRPFSSGVLIWRIFSWCPCKIEVPSQLRFFQQTAFLACFRQSSETGANSRYWSRELVLCIWQVYRYPRFLALNSSRPQIVFSKLFFPTSFLGIYSNEDSFSLVLLEGIFWDVQRIHGLGIAWVYALSFRMHKKSREVFWGERSTSRKKCREFRPR